MWGTLMPIQAPLASNTREVIVLAARVSEKQRLSLCLSSTLCIYMFQFVCVLRVHVHFKSVCRFVCVLGVRCGSVGLCECLGSIACLGLCVCLGYDVCQ